MHTRSVYFAAIGGVIMLLPALSLTQGTADIAADKAAEPDIFFQAATLNGTHGRHCAVQIEPVQEGDISSAVKDLGCYTTFAEAISAATRGEVQLDPRITPETITEADLRATYRTAIGIDFDLSYYGGASQTWSTTTPVGCFGLPFGGRYQANMPSWFNNRLSSTRAFVGCRLNYSFTGYNQTGYWKPCYPDCPYIGNFMNNTTSSKRWSR
jgi:hypothetical protein